MFAFFSPEFTSFLLDISLSPLMFLFLKLENFNLWLSLPGWWSKCVCFCTCGDEVVCGLHMSSPRWIFTRLENYDYNSSVRSTLLQRGLEARLGLLSLRTWCHLEGRFDVMCLCLFRTEVINVLLQAYNVQVNKEQEIQVVFASIMYYRIKYKWQIMM